MNILGISAYYHDSAAALLQKGQVIAAALEERFTRVKHDSRFPLQSIQYCLESAHMSIADVDLIAYYEEPVEKCARQLWAGFDRLNHHSVDFCKKISTCRIEQDIREKLGFDGKIEYFPHHHSHAALAFYGSGFDTAAVLVVDGVGEWASTSFGIAQNNEIHFYRHIEFPDSLGLFYSAMTSFLGFSVNDGEYKVMGLAPYGLPKFVKLIRSLLSNGSGFGCHPFQQPITHQSTPSYGIGYR